MSDFSNIQIPKPKDWQDFERKCRILFACELGDPNTQLNGRGGQPQNGVDIWGCRQTNGGNLVGIQCKGKGGSYKTSLTETELRNEVEKARGFEPAISEFIVATTAPADQVIQKEARLINEELSRDGVQLEVHVYGWQELEARISQYQEALKAFYPDATLFTDEMIKNQEALKTSQDTMSDKFDGVQTDIQNHGTMLLQILDRVTDQKGPSGVRDQEIDRYAALIKEGNPGTALKLFEQLWENLDEADTQRTRYRIRANIGFANLRLGDQALAAEQIIEAFNYDPGAKSAKTNLAAAYLMQDEFEKCAQTAEEVLKQNPSDEHAGSYLIQAKQHIDPVEDPLSLVPEELRGNPTVIAAAVFGLRLNDDPCWVEAALEWQGMHPDDSWLERLAAEAVITKTGECPGLAVGAAGDLDVNALSEAVDVLSKEWSEVVQCGALNFDPSLPHNLAQGLRVLSRHEEALEVVAGAIERGADRSYLKRLAAVLTARTKSIAEALAFLNEIDPTDHEDFILKAELLQDEDAEAALRLLESHDFSSASHELRYMAKAISIECRGMLPTHVETIQDQLEKLREEFPELGVPLWLRARLIRLQQSPDQSEIAVKLADEVSEETNFSDRLQICELLEDVERFDEAADLLEGYVAPDRPSPAFWLYLRVLANSNRKKLANDVVAGLDDEIRNLPRCLDIRSVIARKAGDMNEAIKCCEDYIELKPEVLKMRLRWARFCLNADRKVPVRKWIEQDVESLSGLPDDKAELAMLLDYFGKSERALAFAYQLARLHSRSAGIQRTFSALMLLRSSASDELDGLLKISKIAPDTVFWVTNDIGETLEFRIESDANLRLESNDKAPDDDISKTVIDLKIGDTFTFPGMVEHGEKTNWTIEDIKHKYVALLNDILPHGEERYGEDFGFHRYNLELEGPQPFEPMLRMLRQRNEQIQLILDQYKTNSLPFRFTARVLGGDVCGLYDTLPQVGHRFRCCIGTTIERKAAIAVIRSCSQKGCVIDAITLEIIRRLNVRETVEAVCGPIHITQGCLDEFLRQREQLNLGGIREQKTIHFDGENYVFHEATAEDVQKEFERRTDVVEWVKSFEIVPAIGQADPGVSERSFQTECDPEFFDDVLAAEGQGFLLISEDFGYRLLISLERAVKMTWLQPIFMYAVSEGILTSNAYTQIVINLCQAGHDFTSVSSSNLAYAGDHDPAAFTALVEILVTPEVEVSSKMGVCTFFLRHIWTLRPCELVTSAQTGAILTGFYRHHGDEWEVVRNYFTNKAGLPFGFTTYFADWVRGHFLK